MLNWAVYTKVAEHSPWKFTGVIESDRANAHKRWSDIIRKLRHHSYRLEPVAAGRIPLERI